MCNFLERHAHWHDFLQTSQAALLVQIGLALSGSLWSGEHFTGYLKRVSILRDHF